MCNAFWTNAPEPERPVALGVDGLKEDHEKDSRQSRKLGQNHRHRASTAGIQKRFPRLDVQTCTCFMNSESRIASSEWYDFLRYELKPDKSTSNYPFVRRQRPQELNIDLSRYPQTFADD